MTRSFLCILVHMYTRTAHRRVRGLLLMLVVVGAVVATDLWVKWALVPRLPSEGFIAGPVGLALSFNTGVGLSLGASLPGWVVTGATAGLIGVIGVLTARSAWGGGSRPRVVGLSLAVGGALGNLLDRAADGRVTDFIRLPWFTCNLADVAITAGIGLVMVHLLLTTRTTVPHEPA